VTDSPLRRLRTERNLSMEALAFAAGVSSATVYRAETGRHVPNRETLAALAAALNVTVADLETPESTAEPARVAAVDPK
jgi:transcriptional regulator with XRE-family HTH domain